MQSFGEFKLILIKVMENEERKEELKKRVNEIIVVINSKKELLEQFDKDIFNALVDKIEIITPTHFIFVFKSGVRADKNI